MNRSFKRIAAMLVLAAMALAIAGCATSAKASEVTFALTGVECKGTTSTDSLVAPPADPATLSGGYRYKKPGDADKADVKKWEVSTYVWTPGAMTVRKGDTVKLRTFIVNGDVHATRVIAPDGKDAVSEQVLNRGREATLTFKATQPGVYRVLCKSHVPTMEAIVTVL